MDLGIEINKRLSQKKKNYLMRLYLEKNKITSDKIVSMFI